MDDVLNCLSEEMGDTLSALRRELGRTRTGRASTALLEGIFVEYYGSKTPLNQIATLGAPEPRLLTIQPFDKTSVGDIERAILRSDLGLVPLNDGSLIRVPIPELTEERRRELVKRLKKLAEEYRVSLRNHRRDAIDLLKGLEKDKKITSDELHRAHDKVQDVTRRYSEQLEKILAAKEAEILEV